MANEKQTSLHDETGWRHDERMPDEVEPSPALVLAWNGLQIAISEGQMTWTQAAEMLRGWDKNLRDEPV